MKKLILNSILLLYVLCAHSQNWQLVRSNTVQWYKHFDNNLKVIFTDSVKTINQDSIFYFPVTLGTRTKDPHGLKVEANIRSPWWIGSKMIWKADGSQLFFNAENDTLLFFAGKSLNDEWVMVKYANGNYVKAKIKSVGADTISGMLDSIKTIEVRKYSKTDIAGSFYPDIIISKNNGFVNVFPLFSVLDSQEWFYELHMNKYAISSYMLSAIGKRLSYRDVYGYDKGDVFQVINYFNIKKTKILDKQDFGDSIKYSIEEEKGDLRGGYHMVDVIQKDWWIHNYNSLYYERYPEQYDTGNFVEYFYRINACGLITISRTSVPIFKIDDTLYYINFEVPVDQSVHGEHLGMIDSSLITIDGLLDYKYSLIYNKNKNCNIGLGPIGINESLRDIPIELFPNPVISDFKLSSNILFTNIRIFNSFGEEVFLKTISEHTFDASSIKPGLYFIVVNDNNIMRFIKVAP